MMSSRKNATRDRMSSVRIGAADLSKDLIDGRQSMRRGTTEQACLQHGVSIRREGRTAVLSGRRDQLQLVVEILHYSAVDYSVVP